MKNEEHRQLLKKAASTTIVRFRRDEKNAPKGLKKIFPYLEQNIFDRNLDVARMRRDCKAHDNSLSISFAQATGLTPHKYITERRLETAAILFRDTNLRIWVISDLTGFTRQGILTQNFKAYYGMTPRAFRLGIKSIFSKAGCRPEGGMPSIGELQKALSAGQDSREFAALASRIKYCNTRDSALPLVDATQEPPKTQGFEVFLSNKGELERIKAEEVWETLKEKPWNVQRDMIRNRLIFYTPVLFHLLRRNSITEGRDNRKYGAHLAELAMDCLARTEQKTGEDFFHLRGQGWARIGHTRRMTYDLIGAEEAFSTGERYLSEDEAPMIYAEFYHRKAALRRCQKRYLEALEFHDRSLRIFLAKDDSRYIAESLMEKAFIHAQAGETEAAIPPLQRALDVIEEEAGPYLRFSVWFNLATAYAYAGRYEESAQVLPIARKLSTAMSDQVFAYYIQWLDGYIEKGFGNLDTAEDRLLEARRGFPTVGHTIPFALVTLDLALLYLIDGRDSEVRSLVVEIIPLLESVDFQEEVLVCLRMLRGSLEDSELCASFLKNVRTILERIPLDIAS